MTPIAKTRLALSVGRYVLTGFAAGVSAFSFSQSYAVQGWLGSTTDLTAGQSTAVPGLPAGMTFLIPLAALLALSAPALLAGRTGLFKWFAALCLVAHAPALLAHATVDWLQLVWGDTPFSPAPFGAAVTTALVLVTAVAVLSLSVVVKWRAEITSLDDAGFEHQDVATVAGGRASMGGLTVAAATFGSLMVLLVATGLSAVTRSLVERLPWSATFGILLGIAAIAAVAYAVAVERRAREDEGHAQQ